MLGGGCGSMGEYLSGAAEFREHLKALDRHLNRTNNITYESRIISQLARRAFERHIAANVVFSIILPPSNSN